MYIFILRWSGLFFFFFSLNLLIYVLLWAHTHKWTVKVSCTYACTFEYTHNIVICQNISLLKKYLYPYTTGEKKKSVIKTEEMKPNFIVSNLFFFFT